MQTETLLITGTLHQAFNMDSKLDTMQYVRYYHLPTKANMPSALANPEVVQEYIIYVKYKLEE